MTELQPMTLDDGSVIYIQAQSNPPAPILENSPSKNSQSENTLRTPGDRTDFIIDRPDDNVPRGACDDLKEISHAKGEALKSTVQGYTKQVIQSFKDMALAEVTEVSLEFGVNISAGAGIPYIASGSTDCNIKISVKCEFPKTSSSKP